MANDVVFEGKERRMPKIEKCLADNGIESLEAARDLCLPKGIDVESIVKGVQPIAFDNAVWAYTLGVALAIKSGVKTASEASAVIGQGLQAFCVPGSVAEQRNVGLGHGNLGARLLHEDTKCFAFLAGHESFAAAEGAIGIAKTANKVRKTPLRVILNGLGKDAAMIISTPARFAHSFSWSPAAALKVSAPAITTFLPCSLSFPASFPTVVVFPTPLTPITSTTDFSFSNL